MPDLVETGFEHLAPNLAKMAEMEAALPGEPAAPPPPKPAEISPEERRAAEIAEGARVAALHATQPQPVHPSIQQAQAEQEQLERLAVESEAARMNRELFERIKAARNQPPPPPPKPQPPIPAVMRQTELEIAAGRAASARHAEQQRTAVRRQPSAAELQAQGKTTTVYNPDTVIPKEAFPAQPRIPGVQSTDDQKRGHQTL